MAARWRRMMWCEGHNASNRALRSNSMRRSNPAAFAVTIQIAPGSATVCPFRNGASVSRIEALAAAYVSGGWPCSARLAGPIWSEPSTAASSPPPMAMSMAKIMRLHRHVDEAGAFQDAHHALFRGKGERARLFRPDRRHFRNVFVDRHQRRHHPRIFLRLAPAGKGEPPRRLQRAAEVGEGRNGIGEEHHAEARGEQIKARRLERMHRRIRQHEIERQSLWCKRARLRQHRVGDIEAERETAWRDSLRERKGRRTEPQPTSRTRSPGLGLARSIRTSAMGPSRLSCAVAVGPALPAGTIPIGDLVGVLLVSAGLLHWGLPFGGLLGLACEAIARDANKGWWAVTDSNRGPSRCKRDALTS